MSNVQNTVSNIEAAPVPATPSKQKPVEGFLRYDVSFLPDTHQGEARVPFEGNQASQEIVSLAIQEIVNGITERNMTSTYNRWRAYVEGELRKTSGVYTGSEITGLGRLNWFKEIMADPLKGPQDADIFTKELHRDLCEGPAGLVRAILLGGQRLDLDLDIPPYAGFKKKTYRSALSTLERGLSEANVLHGRAIESLSKEELRYFSTNAHYTLTLRTSVGHTVSPRASCRQLILTMEKMDRAAMLEGFAKLAFLTDPDFIAAINKIPDAENDAEPLTLEGVSGTIVQLLETQAGLVVIGGRGENTYELEKMPQVCAVVDLGGDDTYLEGVVNLERPVLAILDLSGDDTYKGNLPGIQGSSLMGISLWVDCQGNDTYTATHFAQGSTIGGAAALVDFSGDDSYSGNRRVQGTAMGGLGLLLDRQGNDKYRGAMWAQGVGQTYGLGILEDCTGDDNYYSGGMYYDSYPETPGYEGWGQGLGTGIRGVAAGGIGVLLEGEGNDHYEYDYIAHGGGYWMGLGFFRDFAGNDEHLGSTAAMWDGSPRRESRFQRFSTGFGCHYAAGFFFEDDGDDQYYANIMSLGFAWDCGVAFTFDLGGDDVWTGAGSGNQGQGAQASLGVLFDYKGKDTFYGSSQGYASGNITYHQLPYCGGNFSFMIDYGGLDTYGSRALNNAYIRRGTSGGFLIDRPDVLELQEQKDALAKAQAQKETQVNTASVPQAVPAN
ncbi:MAG: hypothetical protein Q4D98_00970 [Planctomycetia bacterium]|nr:hypothetical protein [Planctomycetia bacterium]